MSNINMSQPKLTMSMCKHVKLRWAFEIGWPLLYECAS